MEIQTVIPSYVIISIQVVLSKTGAAYNVEDNCGKVPKYSYNRGEGRYRRFPK
jgi:hypothetical protein